MCLKIIYLFQKSCRRLRTSIGRHLFMQKRKFLTLIHTGRTEEHYIIYLVHLNCKTYLSLCNKLGLLGSEGQSLQDIRSHPDASVQVDLTSGSLQGFHDAWKLVR